MEYQTNIQLTVKQTSSLAKAITQVLDIGDMIILSGNLGAGKTHLIRELLRLLEYTDEVTSPTFSLVNIYEANICNILHIDLYRLNTSDEFVDLGVIEYFDNSITMIEWGDKFLDLFEDYLLINIYADIYNIDRRNYEIMTSNIKFKGLFEEIKKMEHA